jgi:hypothetical protein
MKIEYNKRIESVKINKWSKGIERDTTNEETFV